MKFMNLSLTKGEIALSKKNLYTAVAISLVFVMLLFVLFGMLCFNIFDIFVYESPNGDYQIVSLWIDKGGFGYGGNCYIKEKGLLSKWHKICKVPCGCKWISETQFIIDRANYSGIVSYKEYSVNDFFGK